MLYEANPAAHAAWNEDKFFCGVISVNPIAFLPVNLKQTATQVETIGIHFEIKRERTTEARNSNRGKCVAEH